jgi:hypothetical protein
MEDLWKQLDQPHRYAASSDSQCVLRSRMCYSGLSFVGDLRVGTARGRADCYQASSRGQRSSTEHQFSGVRRCKQQDGALIPSKRYQEVRRQYGCTAKEYNLVGSRFGFKVAKGSMPSHHLIRVVEGYLLNPKQVSFPSIPRRR